MLMIDLHTHSTVSDGTDPPERIPQLAAAAGCSAVALTDHDRLDGLAAAAVGAAEAGVELVPGCEISCAFPGGAMHLLVYFVEAGEGPLQDELVHLQEVRARRNDEMVGRLRTMGLPITAEEVEAEAGGIGAGRPHMAAVLVRNGAAADVNDAFDRFVGDGAPGYVEKVRLTPDRALALATASGGVPVLAHPTSLRRQPHDLERWVRELAAIGLQGLEAVYGRYRPDQRDGLAALARRHGLVVTGGSDHHGDYKPDLHVGIGTGDLHVPDEALSRLRERQRA
jgi:predicted metal-dependent phosphoesterase TrpH